jgi:uncharacterized protein
MRIGVISDTHLNEPNLDLVNLSEGLFADVDMVLHAGDLTNILVLDVFGDKKVQAVCGNMDRGVSAASLPAELIVQACGYRIGLTHGWGSSHNIEARIRTRFENVDAIVYGHSHKAANHVSGGVLMFNPGSFSGSYPLGRKRSVGILTLDEGKNGIRGKIVSL